MPVEQGQLRVWEDAMSLSKTPFLVLDPVDKGRRNEKNWRILTNGKIQIWFEGQIELLSEVIDEEG